MQVQKVLVLLHPLKKSNPFSFSFGEGAWKADEAKKGSSLKLKFINFAKAEKFYESRKDINKFFENIEKPKEIVSIPYIIMFLLYIEKQNPKTNNN